MRNSWGSLVSEQNGKQRRGSETPTGSRSALEEEGKESIQPCLFKGEREKVQAGLHPGRRP